MIRVRIPLFCSFVLGVVANGCVANQAGPDEGPSDQASAPLLCSGSDFAQKYYRDADHDGHASPYGTLFCSYPGAGWYDEPGDDCNDYDATVYPGAPEIVGDGKDSNCDGKDPDGAGPVTNKYRMISIRVFQLCDSDGTDCGTETADQVKRAIDSLNSYLWRSDSKVRFKLSDASATLTYGQLSAAPFGKINSDFWNNDCRPISGFSTYPNDANGDGTVDKADAAFLCKSITENTSFSSDFENFQKAVEAQGDVPVFARGGIKGVEFKDGLWQRAPYTGGYSSCDGHKVMLKSNWAGGTFMAHELGHYFCLPHTMAEGNAAPSGQTPSAVISSAKTKIQNYVSSTGVSPTATTTILNGLWDPDRNNLSSYDGDHAYIQSYPINDTPADPGLALWRATHGVALDDDATDCSTTSPTMNLSVSINGTSYPYAITPNRTLIMSYFKGCFDYRQHYSPQETARLEAVSSPTGHRGNTGKDVFVAGWNNTSDITIPSRLLGLPLSWVGSSIPVTGSGTINRIKLHIDASNPSALHVRLITPNGTITVFDPTAGSSNTGYVKGIYYLDGAGIPKTGTWRLEVASEYADLNAATGKLYDWRIEFE